MTIPPINIKIEEPLIIDESVQVESQAVIQENYENPSLIAVPNVIQNNLNTSKTSSQGCLNDISEIFKDATPAKISSSDKIDIVKSKIAPVQQKKNLVRCVDSNGKIVFVQLQVDPNNPKNIKIVKTPTVVAPTQPTAQNLSRPLNVTQLKLNTPMEQIRQSTPMTNIRLNTSNSPNLSMVHPITSTRTTLNPKPIMVQSNSNLSRFNPSEAKSLLENKKIFIIKSSTLPNISSTNPPPLVRINQNKVVLAPNMASVKVIQPPPKPTEARKLAINSNNVLMKNGQIIILDKDKSLLKPKQESLLKPQISLLKPLYQKQISEATSTKTNSIQKPSCNLLGPRFRKQIPLNQNAVKRDYHKEFYVLFSRHRFQTIRSAVEYLLRNIPLVNSSASKPEFNTSFPFVTVSQEKFNSFPLPKRRSSEVCIRQKC